MTPEQQPVRDLIYRQLYTPSPKSEPKLAAIVAMALDGAIGHDNDLLWHLPGDLKRFKELTTGHTVIMGRRTWQSLPRRPLPGRRNIVISGDHMFDATGAEVAHSPAEALDMAGRDSLPVVIGGATIYDTLIPRTDILYLTLVDTTVPTADTRISFKPADWEVTQRSAPMQTPGGLTYYFMTLIRR